MLTPDIHLTLGSDSNFTKLSLVKPDVDALQYLFPIHPDVLRFDNAGLYMPGEFFASAEAHFSTSEDPLDYKWAISVTDLKGQEHSIGSAGLLVNHFGEEDEGPPEYGSNTYILDPNFLFRKPPLRIGRFVGLAMAEFAFRHLEIDALYATISSGNIPSRNAHRILGYRRIVDEYNEEDPLAPNHYDLWLLANPYQECSPTMNFLLGEEYNESTVAYRAVHALVDNIQFTTPE